MADKNTETTNKISYWKLMTRRKQISTMVIKNDVINNKTSEAIQPATSQTNTTATTTITTNNLPNNHHKQYLPTATVFDLSSVGLSATLAITVFIIIGYVAKDVAGPSVIFSVVIAATIAFLTGKLIHTLNLSISWN